jgi:hypothetical protein
VLRTKEHTLTSYPSIVFTFGFAIESIKELGGASRVVKGYKKKMEQILEEKLEALSVSYL